MFSTLRQPFPSQKNSRHTLRMCFIASICVLAVFYFFKPFGLDQLTDAMAAATGLQFALVTLVLSVFCTTIIPLLFPSLFNEKHWTVLHEMLFLICMVLLIALGNVWLTSYLFGKPLSLTLLFNTIKYTLVIGAAPVFLSVLVKQQQLLARYSREARQIEAQLTMPTQQPANLTADNIPAAALESRVQAEVINPAISKNETVTSPPLQLKGANHAEILQLDATDFLFAAAADNYTSIHYLQNGQAKQVLFRLTIKGLSEQTAGVAGIFRCHKSFLVNLQQVVHISGNAQGYKLHLLQNELTVPVSRTLNNQIKQKLEALHQQ